MLRLFSIVCSLASTVLVGVFLVFALTAGFVSGPVIVGCIAAGFVLAMPVAWRSARALRDR